MSKYGTFEVKRTLCTFFERVFTHQEGKMHVCTLDSRILNDNICQIRQDKNAASLTSVKNIVDTILNCILVTGRVLSLVFAI